MGGDNLSITEFSFSVDDFKNPKVYKDADAIMISLVRLLLLEPGTYQSHPDMGVGLQSRFMYSDVDRASELRTEFQRQINLYLPAYQGVKISVEGVNKSFRISAEIDSVLYGILYDTNTKDLKYSYVRLSDL